MNQATLERAEAVCRRCQELIEKIRKLDAVQLDDTDVISWASCAYRNKLDTDLLRDVIFVGRTTALEKMNAELERLMSGGSLEPSVVTHVMPHGRLILTEEAPAVPVFAAEKATTPDTDQEPF